MTLRTCGTRCKPWSFGWALNICAMQNLKAPAVQGAHAGRFLAGWFPSRPCHPSQMRFHSRDSPIAAAARDSISALDLIEWPEGTRPKRGGVTKASLTRLKVLHSARNPCLGCMQWRHTSIMLHCFSCRYTRCPGSSALLVLYLSGACFVCGRDCHL